MDVTHLTALRRELHSNPELGFKEHQTAERVARHLSELGLEVHRGVGKTGVVGVLRRGASVRAFDPVALPEARRLYAGEPRITLVERAADALEGADALVIVTEWKEFRSPDFGRIRSALRQPVVFDGRNLFAPAIPEAEGIEYHAIGRRTAVLAGGG